MILIHEARIGPVSVGGVGFGLGDMACPGALLLSTGRISPGVETMLTESTGTSLPPAGSISSGVRPDFAFPLFGFFVGGWSYLEILGGKYFVVLPIDCTSTVSVHFQIFRVILLTIYFAHSVISS